MGIGVGNQSLQAMRHATHKLQLERVVMRDALVDLRGDVSVRKDKSGVVEKSASACAHVSRSDGLLSAKFALHRSIPLICERQPQIRIDGLESACFRPDLGGER